MGDPSASALALPGQPADSAAAGEGRAQHGGGAVYKCNDHAVQCANVCTMYMCAGNSVYGAAALGKAGRELRWPSRRAPARQAGRPTPSAAAWEGRADPLFSITRRRPAGRHCPPGHLAGPGVLPGAGRRRYFGHWNAASGRSWTRLFFARFLSAVCALFVSPFRLILKPL